LQYILFLQQIRQGSSGYEQQSTRFETVHFNPMNFCTSMCCASMLANTFGCPCFCCFC
jgi:hypothetical protein